MIATFEERESRAFKVYGMQGVIGLVDTKIVASYKILDRGERSGDEARGGQAFREGVSGVRVSGGDGGRRGRRKVPAVS